VRKINGALAKEIARKTDFQAKLQNNTLQVDDLVKLGFLTSMTRTYYHLMGTYYYLDLLGGVVF
jgi:hypothetical protein